MATEDRGYRVTSKRAAELREEIAELRGELKGQLERLEREVEALKRRGDLGFELARARIAAELTILKGAGG